MRYKIVLCALLILACALCGVGYATTVLTDGTAWCAGVKSPDPGDYVRASSGTIGTVRDGLQCLANRTSTMIRGRVSFYSLYVDGTGGAAVAGPAAGNIDATGTITGQDLVSNDNLAVGGAGHVGHDFIAGYDDAHPLTVSGTSAASSTLPNSTVAESTLTVDGVPFARGNVSGVCNCRNCVNVQGVTMGVSTCTITMKSTPSRWAGVATTPIYPTILVTPMGGGSSAYLNSAPANSGGKLVVVVNNGGAADFGFVVWP